MKEKIVKLKYSIPYEVDSKTINLSEITLRRMKAKDFKHLPKSLMRNEGKGIAAQDMLPLIAAISDLPLKTIEELDIEDMINISKELEDFLAVSPESGEKLSG
jgi:hypothetical protein